ncbi:unnamed protein product [Blepharisma stoltei]|uniref:Uncharacterized protein n=1 Tax=Blepharisma stoltei TaxID=1481888 RepID=A0AAU9IF75_9CILI|nr:unnamed protein product [Blepharisma stoltei]
MMRGWSFKNTQSNLNCFWSVIYCFSSIAMQNTKSRSYHNIWDFLLLNPKEVTILSSSNIDIILWLTV